MRRTGSKKKYIDETKVNKGTGNNNVSNYKKGVRRKVISLLLYAGVIDFNKNILIGENHRSMLTKLGIMEKEGIICKSCSPIGPYISFTRINEETKTILSTYFSKELVDFFYNHSKNHLYRFNMNKDLSGKSKSEKASALTDLDRSFSFSQLVLFVDGLGVDYIPGGYNYTKDSLNYPVNKKVSLKSTKPISNAFYSIYELQETYSLSFASENLLNVTNREKTDCFEPNKESFSNKISGTRALGLLFLGNIPYVTYCFTNSVRKIMYGPETYLKNHIDTHLLPHHNMEPLEREIVFYQHSQVITQLLSGNDVNARIWFSNLSTEYNKVLFIPSTPNGQDYCRIMQEDNWEDMLKQLVCLRRGITLNPMDNDFIEADGFFMHKDGTKRYILLYTVPDMGRLLRFINHAAEAYELSRDEGIENKESYEVLCFDFQKDSLKPFESKYHFVLNSINFHTIKGKEEMQMSGIYEAYMANCVADSIA